MEPEQQPRPDFLAAADQVRASLGTIAGVLGGYFGQLLDEGFEREEALELVSDWHREWLAQCDWSGGE